MRVLLKKSILSGAAVLLPFLLSGAELFTKVKVELRQESPPEPNLKASGSYGNRQRLINAHWLVFRIEYSPSSPSSHNAWCDDVDMAVRAVIPGPGSKEYTAFTGVTRLWTVRLDGRVHTAVMAIPPQLLDRYVSAAPGATGGGAALNRSQMKVEVTFRNTSGVVLGRGYCNCDGATFNRLFRSAGRRVVEGAILPRDLTPWFYQSQAYYDMIRPNGVEPRAGAERPVPPAPEGGGAKSVRHAPQKK